VIAGTIDDLPCVPDTENPRLYFNEDANRMTVARRSLQVSSMNALQTCPLRQGNGET